MKDRAIDGFLGNFYGKHDGFDGSVYDPGYIGKAVVASPGGDLSGDDSEESKWRK